MNTFMLDVVLFLLASPILFLRWVFRLIRRWIFYRMAYTVRITCRNCGAPVSLVGLWRCACGFTYRGHVLRSCPICGALPRMLRCYVCGVTERLPERCA